jgi:uncharacterized integral membrane protein
MIVAECGYLILEQEHEMNVENSKFDHSEPQSAASGSEGPNVTLIVLGVAIVLLVVFFLQNSNQLRLNFLFFERTTTVRWSLLVAVLLGVAIDRFGTMWWRRRKARKE